MRTEAFPVWASAVAARGMKNLKVVLQLSDDRH